MSYTPLYIDPGTGSMLFSVFIGVVATFFFLLRAAVLKLQLLFSGRKALRHPAPKAETKRIDPRRIYTCPKS